MGLFNSESKEEKAAKKQARKEQKDLEMLQKYRLEALRNPDDIESVRDIMFELQSIGWMNLVVFLNATFQKFKHVISVH